ncbi:tRNA (guanosine(46)-N7)-methyltransferase TrmB [Varunaivibrio sulfuroxidans]|uniref:tRNA (guanine-N(7)-)-methyltransferase n=1 Tax=Varunaivibrio sulfuroxidans TaxID=1773489 RepID=A0A4R3JHR1_9PROT|nr:tRNA (guanosine(46)-N7)-methyltransferase TrmB [Varunaivibrio sulfuroxidans]TCS65055.1 tRNA (guanine-N7-)-methyltransferase [Varunaivibrio sulfuroxidans]WES29658.1 tRNA (guanosine(46)-N7)-methyltransferase TrmB [Varunaivibrio sulfuroxidans]
MTADSDAPDKEKGASSQAAARLPFYGRRQGHKLRPARQDLIDTYLPTIRVDPRGSLVDLFPDRLKELWFEVGFGGGEHLAQQARAHPDIGFIGCEPFKNGVASLLSALKSHDVRNVRVYDDDARHLFAMLPEASLDRFFVLFPDPWPKTRHHKRRFINPENLNHIARLLKDGGALRVASDHMDYVRWALFHVLSHPDFEWTARRPGDWRTPPADWIATRYEEKALAGDRPAYLCFRRRRRSLGDGA